MSDITFFFTLQLGVFISGVATVAFLFKFLFRLTEVEDRVSSSSACKYTLTEQIYTAVNQGPGGNQIVCFVFCLIFYLSVFFAISS